MDKSQLQNFSFGVIFDTQWIVYETNHVKEEFIKKVMWLRAWDGLWRANFISLQAKSQLVWHLLKYSLCSSFLWGLACNSTTSCSVNNKTWRLLVRLFAFIYFWTKSVFQHFQQVSLNWKPLCNTFEVTQAAVSGCLKLGLWLPKSSRG